MSMEKMIKVSRLIKQSNWRCWNPRRLLEMKLFLILDKAKKKKKKLPCREGANGGAHISVEIGAAD